VRGEVDKHADDDGGDQQSAYDGGGQVAAGGLGEGERHLERVKGKGWRVKGRG
jgi:hypothetical protein